MFQSIIKPTPTLKSQVVLKAGKLSKANSAKTPNYNSFNPVPVLTDFAPPTPKIDLQSITHSSTLPGKVTQVNTELREPSSALQIPRDPSFVTDFRSQERLSNFSVQQPSNLHFKGLALINKQEQFYSQNLSELLSNKPDDDEEMTKDIDELDSCLSPDSRVENLGPLSCKSAEGSRALSDQTLRSKRVFSQQSKIQHINTVIIPVSVVGPG